jgi:hypothetical protein
MRSCSSPVLVNQTAQEVASADLGHFILREELTGK